MRSLKIGDVTVTSIIERDGPWRRPEDMFPAYDPDLGRRYLAEMDPEVYDPASNRMVITYQTFVVRTPHHTILVDTCTGEDKGYPAPMDFPKQPWLDGFRAEGPRFEGIDDVFCTHLHIDHCGWNTVLRDGRWVPTFPNAKYSSTGASMPPGRPRAATSRRGMSGCSTASRSSPPDKHCWLMTTMRWTTPCR